MKGPLVVLSKLNFDSSIGITLGGVIKVESWDQRSSSHHQNFNAPIACSIPPSGCVKRPSITTTAHHHPSNPSSWLTHHVFLSNPLIIHLHPHHKHRHLCFTSHPTLITSFHLHPSPPRFIRRRIRPHLNHPRPLLLFSIPKTMASLTSLSQTSHLSPLHHFHHRRISHHHSRTRRSQRRSSLETLIL